MRRFAFVLMAAFAAGCGGSSESAPPAGPLNPAFAKTWVGDLVMTCTGIGSTTYPGGSVPITVSGQALTARLGCTDGSTFLVTATGAANTATWTGSTSCPPSSAGTCTTWVFTRTSATFNYNSNATITVNGVGTLVGCGNTLDCTTLFNGL